MSLEASNTQAIGNANLWRSNDGNTILVAYGNFGRNYGIPSDTGIWRMITIDL